MPLIVNADDFGKNDDVNSAVSEAFVKGYITSTTLMVNMPGAGAAYELAKEKGFAAKVGIHLNITEGMPLTEAIRSNPLVCAPDGRFNAAFYHSTKYRLYMDNLTMDQIRDELDAQISMFLDMGFKTLHVDSHHHVHTNYPIYRILKKLSSKYDFDYIRLSRNLYRGGSLFNNTYKHFYNSSVKKLAVQTSDMFGSYKDLMEYFSLDPMRGADRIKEPPGSMKHIFSDRTVEIMVHPMHDGNNELVDTDIPMRDEGHMFSYQS
ncbi:MAG: ChbG/HpnK family deacetylase [Lachnospiraceae bacterium]|nr:ChbG/HpnK family deacetylase [Lachnospiraceae bacterium]